MENVYCLSDSHYMSDLVPFILKEEQCRVRKEISSRPVVVFSDGTTHLEQALAVVLQLVSDEWTLEQQLVRMQLLKHLHVHVTGEEIARELISYV